MGVAGAKSMIFFSPWGKQYRLWELLASKGIKGPLLSFYWQRPGCKARVSWVGGRGCPLAQELTLSGDGQPSVLEVRGSGAGLCPGGDPYSMFILHPPKY